MYEIPTDKRLAELFLVRTCQVFLEPVLLDLILGSGTSTMGFKRQCHVRFAVAWPLLQMWHSIDLVNIFLPSTLSSWCRRCYLTRLSRHVARKYLRESELSTGVDRLSTSVWCGASESQASVICADAWPILLDGPEHCYGPSENKTTKRPLAYEDR